MERAGANLAQGSISFSGAETGYDFASFLMGLPNSTQTPEGEPKTFPRVMRWGAYINDDWKVTPRLTVNYGLRFDYVGVPHDAQGLWRTLDFPGDGADVGRGQGHTTPDGKVIPAVYPSTVDEQGAVKPWKQDVKFFMPRLGIAYRPTDKWVLRIGAGWFDNINHLNTWTILNLMPPKSGSLLYNSVTDEVSVMNVPGADGGTYPARTRRYRSGTPIITLDDPFLTRTTAQATRRPVNVLHIKPDNKDSDVWKWSFDVQRELPSNIAVTIGYVGSKGTHVGNSIGNFNQASPSADTNFQARRPYQEFYDPATPHLGIQALGNIRYLDSYGNSFYHGCRSKPIDGSAAACRWA
jgi:hypothetical protein